MTAAEKTAVLIEREDNAIRAAETANGLGLRRVARQAMRRWARANGQRRAIEAGFAITVRPRGIEEKMAQRRAQQRSEAGS